MKKTITLLLTLAICFALAACGQKPETENTTTEPTESITASTTETTTAPSTKESQDTKDWNVTAVKADDNFFDAGTGGVIINGLRASFYDNGVYYIDTKTGKETVVTSDGSWIYAFDGETILYLRHREDPSVDFDKNYVLSYEDGEAVTADSYKVADVMKYDIKSGKTEKLFTKYCAGGGIVYFNDEAVYYQDILESQIGYKNNYDPYAMHLYRYDLNTGKRELLSQETLFDETVIFIHEKPYILHDIKLYDIGKKEWLKDDFGGYYWSYKDRLFFVSEGLGDSEDSTLEGSIWEYQFENGTSKKLYDYEYSEEMRYAYLDVGNRYVLVGADVSKKQNEYTVSYSASGHILYDLLTQKTIGFDDGAYDAVYSVDNVIVTWIDLLDGQYEIGYIDDDGNYVEYGRVKADNLPKYQDAEGYYLETEEYEMNDNAKTQFVEYPLDFLS